MSAQHRRSVLDERHLKKMRQETSRVLTLLHFVDFFMYNQSAVLISYRARTLFYADQNRLYVCSAFDRISCQNFH